MGQEAQDTLQTSGGVQMSVDEVVAAIATAAQGRRVSWVLGSKNRRLNLLVRWLPEAASRALLQRALA